MSIPVCGESTILPVDIARAEAANRLIVANSNPMTAAFPVGEAVTARSLLLAAVKRR
ncbi:MAG: hypothetical protein DDT37_02022 [Firmicutes bacterium]|nr:hypothetical protein [candidate division NPL-UPA2 bacterium]